MNKDIDAFASAMRARERELVRAQERNTQLEAQIKQAKRDHSLALAAIGAELKAAHAELKAAERKALLASQNTRNKLRRITEQRDAHRARCTELRAYLAKYQAEVVRLRPPVNALPWGEKV